MRRRLAAVAAGAGLSALAHHLLPLPPGDPFRGTLVLLPLVVAGLLEIGRWAGERGGRRTPGPVARGEAAALAVLVLLALGRRHLGLAGAEPALAAAFALLLAHRLLRLLLALRPALGRRLPRRPPFAFAALPFLAYLAILPWSTAQRPPDGDEPYYLLVTHSLAYDLDAELADNYAREHWRAFLDRPLEPQPGDPTGPGGQVYSRHNALLPAVLAPAYRLAGKHGALAGMAAFAALLAWTTLRLARHYHPHRPGEALAAYALVAFTPPLLLYSHQVWVEVPAALLAALALDGTLALGKGSRWGWRQSLGIGLPLVLLPLVKIRFMVLAVPLLALGWWRAGRPRRWLLLPAAALAAVGAGLLLHNWLLYANPLKIHSWEEVALHRYGAAAFVKGTLGLFYDAAFGLFPTAPLWMLLLPAALLLLARRHPLPAHLAAFAGPYLLLIVPRQEWYGGWSPPFRYALVILPLLGIALIPLLARRRRPGARALLAGLGALTLALTLLWLAVPGWTYDFAHGRTDLLDGLSRRLGADVARFFPSFVRLRPASWLWPPASLALVSLLWWLPRRRGRGALWGIAGLLLAAAALPVAAHHLPTRRVEMEDPQVGKEGGHLYPERWVVARTRFRGGWVLLPGDAAVAPVVPGGRRVDLAVHLRPVGPEVELALAVAAGEAELGVLPVAPGGWREIRLEGLPWPGGEPLRLTLRGPPGAGAGAILDRVELRWR